MNAVEIRNLCKNYPIGKGPLARLVGAMFPGLPGKSVFGAIRDLSLEIPRGQAVGLVGQNGSGKSTLLAMIAGVVTPSSGALSAKGRVAALLELGAGFNREFTGRENVQMHGALLGFKSDEMRRRAKEIEEFAEIGDFMDRPVKTYSSGMFVRLAFSAAINLEPDIVLIDEALSVGDAYFQHKCFARLKQLRSQGITMVFVSHDLPAVKRLCDRAILMERGQILKDGETDVVLDFYNAIIARKEGGRVTAQAESRQTRSGDFRARFESVEMAGPDAEAATAFRIGDMVEIRCRVQFRESLDDPTIGFMIRDKMGSDVYGTNTYHAAPLGRRVEAGETLVASFRIPLNIGPGDYSLTVASHAGVNHVAANYDWWDKAYYFQVFRGSEPYFEGAAYLPLTVSVKSHKEMSGAR